MVGEPLCVTEIAFAAAPLGRSLAVSWIFPLETLLVAIVVAVIPYLVVRGLASNRLAGLGQEFTAT